MTADDSCSLKREIGPKKDGPSDVVTGVFRQSSEDLSNAMFRGVNRGEGKQSPFLKGSKLPLKSKEVSAKDATDSESIPSIIIMLSNDFSGLLWDQRSFDLDTFIHLLIK